MPRYRPEKTEHNKDLNIRLGNRLQKMARMIEAEMRKAGATKDEAQFSLIIWGPERMQYVSNAERADVKKAMTELVNKWDKADEDLGKPEGPLGGLVH